MTWRIAALPDAALLAALHAAAFSRGWDHGAFASLLSLPGTTALVAAPASPPDAPPAGFILLRAAADEAEVVTLAVLPAARRRGCATALLQAGRTAARAQGAATLFLEVAADNEPAAALYRRAGFVECGRRRRYYENGADAILMKIDLA